MSDPYLRNLFFWSFLQWSQQFLYLDSPSFLDFLGDWHVDQLFTYLGFFFLFATLFWLSLYTTCKRRVHSVFSIQVVFVYQKKKKIQAPKEKRNIREKVVKTSPYKEPNQSTKSTIDIFAIFKTTLTHSSPPTQRKKESILLLDPFVPYLQKTCQFSPFKQSKAHIRGNFPCFLSFLPTRIHANLKGPSQKKTTSLILIETMRKLAVVEFLVGYYESEGGLLLFPHLTQKTSIYKGL